ncbi:MAG: hypothetical protein P1S60_11690 [Anaerolineae bacterium]|nr:hypothetical protein [Anaerolineae bacterium]
MTDTQNWSLVAPRLVKSGNTVTLRLREQWFQERQSVPPPSIMIIDVSGHATQTMREIPDQVRLTADGSDYTLTTSFPHEGEYLLLIETPAGVEKVALYALDADLYHRRPYRGDVHMHSNRSDGKEEPAVVAAACRRIGLDFMALTDHWMYDPSLEAIKAFDQVDLELRIFPGEEVHVPMLPVRDGAREGSTPLHIVNFGGSFSINTWIRQHESVFDQQIKRLMEQLPNFPPNMDRRSYAECAWTFDKIREAGGMGIFCHPYWIARERYDAPQALTDLVFDRQPYDALELIGGYYPHETISNHLQVTRYHEERSRGSSIPIVGVSDAHGCNTGQLFGWYTTLVFSPSATYSDLKQSIMDLYSVAVESVPGSVEKAHGPYRLVKYAQFLLREILPAHNELCYHEGIAMQAYLDGEAEAKTVLKATYGSIADFYHRLWGET